MKTIFLGTNHLDTIEKLRRIADKHSYSIYITINNGYAEDFNELSDEDMINVGVPKKIAKEFIKLFENNHTLFHYSYTFYTLELYSKKDDTPIKSNSLTFKMVDFYFSVKEFKDLDDLKISKGLREFLDKKTTYQELKGAFMSFDNCDKTVVQGFKGLNPNDYPIYREGMAIKFFGDMVCDFLHEPRIEGIIY